ncbi:ribosome biogenesis GTP-binding protein YihA/YsxC [Candidatus Thiodictyon syntrophicum]|jgi:GTP-binding protein|uniref:Probable GTP-binding protein EngB n=1 Tax=Candidatus Thiodictyon syntrophicum TaxID=1166950 RepID=A0A2K8U2U4_9GAMM|nr:ribosome biogenesis GTP-binding protein YihA/YsxC [Candidatus Thiodictyon syntrophicum]AUB79903.1 YihA family ribosome biogenesis GTP-binding protein [Candidatus Thiodictyon syntrophicum]
MNPLYQGARFLTAASRIEQAPDDQGREVAFAGRSNAGKSSAINTICHQRGLARTSKTPGRTQLLIFFNLDDERRLVDLPGYGYARVSEAIKLEWQAHMATYLERRQSLAGLVIVMDCRHPLADYDRQMLAWGRRANLPCLLLLTKADKLKRGALLATTRAVEQEAARLAGKPTGKDACPVEVLSFSALEQVGVEPVQAWLDGRLGVIRPDAT